MQSSNAKLQAELTMGGDDQSDRPSNGRAVRNLLEMIQRKQVRCFCGLGLGVAGYITHSTSCRRAFPIAE